MSAEYNEQKSEILRQEMELITMYTVKESVTTCAHNKDDNNKQKRRCDLNQSIECNRLTLVHKV